jgi:ATP-binding cassette subfamily C protein CydCD
VALTGPNGVGKSTALAVLARHLDPLCGRYAVDGHDTVDLDLDATRALLAVVDDEPHVLAGTVRANLLLARPDARDEEVLAAVEAVDLIGWFRTLPDGLGTVLTGLSGGERARLSMARAVLSGRPVVLLDEPAAHLDDATAARALGGLLAAGRERTHVMVSHRPDDVHGWDRVELRAADDLATPPAPVELSTARA